MRSIPRILFNSSRHHRKPLIIRDFRFLSAQCVPTILAQPPFLLLFLITYLINVVVEVQEDNFYTFVYYTKWYYTKWYH